MIISNLGGEMRIFGLIVVTFMLIGSMGLLVLGYLNALHPLLDSISHFRVHFIGVSVILSILLLLLHRSKIRYIYLLLSMGLIGLYYYIATEGTIYKPVGNANTLTHMQYNMNFRNTHLADVLAVLKAQKPDIITLQEVTKSHQEKLETLKTEYPYQRYCAFYPVVGGVAILSRYPFSQNEKVCVEGKGLLISEIQLKEMTLTVASLHLHWPYPYGQYQQIESLKPYLKAIRPPALISGDFNAAPWSHSVQNIAHYSHTNVVKGLRWSIELSHQLPLIPYMKLPIDQLLLSKEIHIKNIQVFPHLGSDHYPIYSTIGFVDGGLR